MKRTTIVLLFGIIFIASVLRLWRLGQVPSSPDWDEVALGYNAYSILKTDRDEYGEFFPMILRSFDDYKPALYSYLAIPSIKLFGLNVFAVRLPSAIFGILTVVATFFLVKELFGKSVISCQLSVISSFLLAISPWHIQFSRVAFESNIGLTFNIFAILFFLKGLRKPWFLLISAFLMGLNLYAYQSEKVFTPFMLLALVIIFRKQLFSLPRKFLCSAIIIGLVVSLPMMFLFLTNKGALARAQGVSIFSNKTELLKGSVERIDQDKKTNDYLGQLLNNRRVVYGKKILENYLSHYDLNWLFITGDPKINRHHAPQMGLLYLGTLPFLLIGIYRLFFAKADEEVVTNGKILVFTWFLIAPIPASVTVAHEVPHAVRTLNFLPTFEIFIGLGILSVYFYLQKLKNNLHVFLFLLIIAILMFNFTYYLNQYFIQQNYYYALDWQYGYKEAIDYIKPVQHKYKKIIVSNQNEMSQSYMFFLFYLEYDPEKFLFEGGTSKQSFFPTKFSNFEFRPFDYYKEGSNILLIGSTKDFPEGVKSLHTVHYPDKSIAVKIAEKN